MRHIEDRMKSRPFIHLLPVAVILVVLQLAMVSAAVQSPRVAIEPLPDRITDADFWSIVTSFSEPGGVFQDENYVSNEARYQQVIPALKKSVKPGAVYIGVGPEQNFTYIAAFRPGVSFVIDIRRQNTLEHLIYKSVFEQSANRAEFFSRLFSRAQPKNLNERSDIADLVRGFSALPRDNALFERNLREVLDHLKKVHGFDLSSDDEKTIQNVYRVFSDAGLSIDYTYKQNGSGVNATYARLITQTDGEGENRSFLASEENFQAVRDLQRRNLIIPIVGDFAGPKALPAIGRYAQEHGTTIGVFYMSNVEQYLFDAMVWKTFYSSVSALPVDSTSALIRSVAPSAARGCFPIASRAALSWASLQGPIDRLVRAYRENRIQNNCDVVRMSQ